jgi:hypothetical protein
VHGEGIRDGSRCCMLFHLLIFVTACSAGLLAAIHCGIVMACKCRGLYEMGGRLCITGAASWAAPTDQHYEEMVEGGLRMHLLKKLEAFKLWKCRKDLGQWVWRQCKARKQKMEACGLAWVFKCLWAQNERQTCCLTTSQFGLTLLNHWQMQPCYSEGNHSEHNHSCNCNPMHK